jgi:hypothetical protein
MVLIATIFTIILHHMLMRLVGSRSCDVGE